MDSIDYYDRYAVPYYEETVDLSMEGTFCGASAGKCRCS